MMLLSSLSPFEWIFQHIALIGWPAVCVVAWKIGKYCQLFLDKAEKTISQIDTLATNHFPHIEASLSRQDDYLKSIDHNIERMADKL